MVVRAKTCVPLKQHRYKELIQTLEYCGIAFVDLAYATSIGESCVQSRVDTYPGSQKANVEVHGHRRMA